MGGVEGRLSAIEARMASMEAKMDKLLEAFSGQQVVAPAGHAVAAGAGAAAATTAARGAAEGAAGSVKSGIAALKAPGGLFSKVAGPRAEPNKQSQKPPDVADLQEKSSHLRRVTTKEQGSGASSAEIAAVAELYRKHEGNADALAAETGADAELLRRSPPKGADDFAQKLLEGAYTISSSVGRGPKGLPSASDLKAGQGRLKHIEEEAQPEKPSEPSAKEVSYLASLYDKCKGDLAALAAAVGASLSSLRKNPPSDGPEFARNLLKGRYSDAGRDGGLEPAAPAEGAGREATVSAEELKAAGSKLNKVEADQARAAAAAGPSEEDVAACAKICTQHGGDLEKIAAQVGIEAWILRKNPPEDATEFARRLLEGSYSDADAGANAPEGGA